MNPPTFTLYLQLQNGDSYIPLSSLGIDLSNYMCGLFSIHGHLDLLPSNGPLQRCFLCCDMLTDQALLPGYLTLPILREIPLPTSWDQPTKNKDYLRLTIREDFSQIIWLDTKNNIFRNIRLYLANQKAQLFSLHNAQLQCTILVFPKKKKTQP